MKKIIIWGINVIVIILTVFLVSCIIRNNIIIEVMISKHRKIP